MRTAISCLALLVAAAAYADDLTVTSKVTRDGGAPATAVSYISSDHLRVAQPDGKEVILDPNTGSMTVLDTAKKTYFVVTKKDMDDMAAMMNERMNSPEMQQAQAQMKNLPPDVQKRMEAMMGGAFKVNVEKTGASRTIAGYHCDEYMMTIGEMSKSTQCLTKDLKIAAQTWEKYRAFADSMKSMAAAFGPMAKGFAQMREEMKKMNGFPLASTTTTTVMGRTSTSTSEVTSVKSGPIPASVWQIPAGYTQTDSPMKSAMSRRRS